MTLRLFCEEFRRIEFLNMFKIFATNLRHLATHAREIRITGDCFETALRLSPAVAQQSQSSEIGALRVVPCTIKAPFY